MSLNIFSIFYLKKYLNWDQDENELGHSFLNSNVNNTYAIFQVCNITYILNEKCTFKKYKFSDIFIITS